MDVRDSFFRVVKFFFKEELLTKDFMNRFLFAIRKAKSAIINRIMIHDSLKSSMSYPNERGRNEIGDAVCRFVAVAQ